MTDNRRASAVPSPQIPPAPPLPLPKQKSRSYFERFVAQPLTTAYASRPSVQAHREGGLPNPLVPKLAGYVASFILVSSRIIYAYSHWLPTCCLTLPVRSSQCL
jgi:hypothetical protein